MKKNYLKNLITITITLAVCAGIGLGFWAVNKKPEPEPAASSAVVDENSNEALAQAMEENGNISDHVFGNPSAEIVLIEYADYECPACSSVAPYIKSIVSDYKDSIAFVFRNFPLYSIHKNAGAAAAIAEAASLQGKFWEMNALLFETQSSWSTSDANLRDYNFNYLAGSLDLDMDRFQSDLTSDNITKKISFDYNLGIIQQVDGTPSFYLNGDYLEYETWSTEQKFRDLLEAAIENI